MNEITVTEEAIAALRTLRLRIMELHKDLLLATKTLANVYQENETGLGYHKNSIRALLEALESEGETSGDPVKKLTLRLKLSADNRQAIIDNDPYGHVRR